MIISGVSFKINRENNHHIELTGFDLWTTALIDIVFIYPSEINIDQFKEALSRTLS